MKPLISWPSLAPLGCRPCWVTSPPLGVWPPRGSGGQALRLIRVLQPSALWGWNSRCKRESLGVNVKGPKLPAVICPPCLGPAFRRDTLRTQLPGEKALAEAKWSSDLASDSPPIKTTARLQAGSGPFQNVLYAHSHRAWALTAALRSPGPRRELSGTLAG